MNLSKCALVTNREADIVRAICTGRSNKEVASSLNISARTIECHRLSIYKKHKLQNGIQMYHWAVRNGLVESPNHNGTNWTPHRQRLEQAISLLKLVLESLNENHNP